MPKSGNWDSMFLKNVIYFTLENHMNMVNVANIQGNLVPPSDSVKDLSVLLTKFHAHTASIIAKANCTLGVIHKSFVLQIIAMP